MNLDLTDGKADNKDKVAEKKHGEIIIDKGDLPPIFGDRTNVRKMQAHEKELERFMKDFDKDEFIKEQNARLKRKSPDLNIDLSLEQMEKMRSQSVMHQPDQKVAFATADPE